MLLVFFTWGTANFMMKLVGFNAESANGGTHPFLVHLYNTVDPASGALAIVIGYIIAGGSFGIAGGGKLGVSRWYLLAGVVGACYITGNWAFLRLTETVDISVLAPVIGLSVTLPVVLGIMTLGESVTPRKIAGILLALAAGVLLSGQS